MLKFYCFITGDQYLLLKEDTPKSKQKVALMANAVLLPVILWTINGYLLARQVLGSTLSVALFTSLVCALVIFLIERTILMSGTDARMKWFRITLGICVALMGALALDEVIFKSDIDSQINRNRNNYLGAVSMQAAASFDSLNNMAGRWKKLELSKAMVNAAEDIAIAEMDGKGSGVIGAGRITNEKLGIAEDRRNAMIYEQLTFDSLGVARADFIDNSCKEAKSNYKAGLMVRVEALFQLVFSDWGMGISYFILTLLMFCIEFVVVIVKSITPESNYERRVKLIEEIGERRMQLLRAKESSLTDPGFCLPNAVAARRTLVKGQSLFN